MTDPLGHRVAEFTYDEYGEVARQAILWDGAGRVTGAEAPGGGHPDDLRVLIDEEPLDDLVGALGRVTLNSGLWTSFVSATGYDELLSSWYVDMEAMGAWEAALGALNTGTGILTVFESYDATLNVSMPHTAGRWTAVNYSAMSNTTTLTQSGATQPVFAAGWRVQIDANLAYAFPVLAVSGDSVIVAGDMTNLAAVDGAYALISPAGIDSSTGAVQTDPLAKESRYLFAGYRHLPAVAGFYVDPDGPGGLPPAIYGAQPGPDGLADTYDSNLAGDYHCGDRIYSTYQGRFTTPRWGRRGAIQLFGDGYVEDAKPDIEYPREFPDEETEDPILPPDPENPPPPSPPENPVPPPERGKVCGPDVSEWFEEEISRHQKAWDNYIPPIPSWVTFWSVNGILINLGSALRMVWNVGPTVAYGALNFTSNDCPVNCPNTVTLYGKCIHDTELGNIAFGVIAQILLPLKDKLIVNASITHGGADKPEDVAGVMAGILLERARKGRGVPKSTSARTLLSKKTPTSLYLSSLYRGFKESARIRKLTRDLSNGMSFLTVMHMASQSIRCRPCPTKLSSSAKHIDYPPGDPASSKGMYEDLEGPGIGLD